MGEPLGSGHFDNDFAVPSRLGSDGEAAGAKPPVVSRGFALATAVLALGAGVGACAGLLTLLLYGIEHAALGFVESPQLPGPFETDWRRRLVSCTLGAVIAAISWFLLRGHAKRVPSVAQAVRGVEMPWWQTLAHAGLQIFIVGTGLSVGREVAPREVGAMLGQRAGRLLRLDDRDIATVVAVAAGAGLAGVYNAPLAGAFFTLEILLADITVRKAVLALACSSLAAWVASLVKGAHAFYELGAVNADFSPDLMLFALPAGIVLGALGAWFRRGSRWAERSKASGRAILWMLPVAGIATGIVAIWVPQVMGNGRATAQMGFSGTPSMALIGLLLLSFAAKWAMTLATIRAGASGGVLTPAIALGSSMGCVLGILWMQLAGTNSIGVYAMLGACALLAASQNAPLMAMSLVMELTDAPMNLFVPAAFICAVAAATARAMERGRAAQGTRPVE